MSTNLGESLSQHWGSRLCGVSSGKRDTSWVTSEGLFGALASRGSEQASAQPPAP